GRGSARPLRHHRRPGARCGARPAGLGRCHARKRGPTMSTLHGSGVGGGLAVGPVLQMAGPLAEPDDTQHGGDAEAELATVTAAIDAVAAELEARGAAAGGEAEQVLKAAVL